MSTKYFGHDQAVFVDLLTRLKRPWRDFRNARHDRVGHLAVEIKRERRKNHNE